MPADVSLDSTQLRQLAVLIDSLDSAAADRLLEQFPEAHQRTIRDALVALVEVSTAEREALAEAFHQFVSQECHCDKSSPAQTSADHREPLAVEHAGPTRKSAAGREAESLRQALRDVEVESLLAALGQEGPAALTLVLAALEPVRAAQFLERLEPDRQAEVLQRLARLGQTDPELLAVLEQAILEQVQCVRRLDSSLPNGRDVLQSILDAAPPVVQRRWHHIIDHRLYNTPALPGEHRGLAAVHEEADDPTVIMSAFEGLAQLESRRLTELFQQLPFDVAVLALAGVNPSCLAELLSRLPSGLAASLQRALREIGPLRLGDIYQAQTAALRLSRGGQPDGELDLRRRPPLKIMA